MACDIRERNLSTTTHGVFKSQISQEKERHYIYIYIYIYINNHEKNIPT